MAIIVFVAIVVVIVNGVIGDAGAVISVGLVDAVMFFLILAIAATIGATLMPTR